jgi:hypothetical protein
LAPCAPLLDVSVKLVTTIVFTAPGLPSPDLVMVSVPLVSTDILHVIDANEVYEVEKFVEVLFVPGTQTASSVKFTVQGNRPSLGVSSNVIVVDVTTKLAVPMQFVLIVERAMTDQTPQLVPAVTVPLPLIVGPPTMFVGAISQVTFPHVFVR